MPLTHVPERFRGLPCIRLHAEGASVLVSLRGAQVLSWVPAGGCEQLFLATNAGLAEGTAIRGGIPVIFPQFGERGPLRKHGFARLRDWSFAGIEESQAHFDMASGPDPTGWPHAFGCRLSLTLSAARLQVALQVCNRGDSSFAFTAALHSYLRVADLAHARVEGLHGCDYEDSASGGTLRRQDHDDLRFDGEVDRIYADVVAPLRLVDGKRGLGISQDGFTDTVVWNPGAQLAASIGDLAPGEYREFVCVEAGQVLRPVVLAPGERWRGSQSLG